MQIKRLRSVLILTTLLLAACSEQPKREQPSSPYPQRIISVVPSATEMLFAFGLSDRIVAVGDYDEFPPEVQGKPRVGGLLNPNIEAIVDLRPDFVVTYGSQDILRERMKEMGIRIFPLTHGNIDETLKSIVELGSAVGAEEKARQIEQHIRSTFEDIQAHAPAHRPRVLLVHSRGVGTLGAFYSVGKRAFQSELIEIAGGMNIFGDVDKEVMEPSIESIVERRPEIIIETLPSKLKDGEAEQRKQDWNKLPKLPAVKNKQIYVISEDYMLVPGPRLDLAARKFAEVIGERGKPGQ
jgi:iron complex transport system substrate-binding protein